MPTKIGFQAKIYFAVIIVLLVAILTSYFSVNYSVGNYMYQNDTLNITNNTSLVESNIATQIQAKIDLSTNMAVSITALKKIREGAGFTRVYKVLNGLAFSDQGSVDSQNELDQLFAISEKTQQSKDGILISNVERLEDKNVIYIAVKQKDNSVNVFYVDLSFIPALIEKADTQGSYIEIFDAKNTLVYSNKLQQNLDSFDSRLTLPGMTWTVKNYINHDYIEANTNNINREIMFALFIATLIIIPLSLFAISIITRPINTLRRVTDQLAQGNGDLTNRIKITSQDDLGKIASNINTFITQLQTMMLQVNSSREMIASGVNSLDKHSQSNQSLIVNHVSETEMVVTAISQMSSTAEAVSESTALAATLTQKADNGVNESRKIVDEAVNSVASLAQEVETMSSAIVDMSNHTDSIGVVLRVIGDIADQTNLLALNAAIEAARAGEQGRGFSVVADEVRALAARTQSSTSEINQMLQELQVGTQSVVDAMAITRSSCQRSAEKTANVTTSLNAMSSEISDINTHTIQIATSAEEQCIVAEEIAQNMTTIKDVINNISENGAMTAETTQELTQANTKLNKVVGQFKM